MRAGNVYWLIAAIAVAAVTIALAAFIVVLAPADSNGAAASVPQVVESRVEAMAESHRNRRAIPPVLAAPAASAREVFPESERRAKSLDSGRHSERSDAPNQLTRSDRL